MLEPQLGAARDSLDSPALPEITFFVCANCARPPLAPTSAGRAQPVFPEFGWPFPVRAVPVACTGRLQPEHILKAFETGSDVVCAIACEEDNCHYLEGSKRCARRVAHIQSILDEVGLDSGRLMLFHLPGTAEEDMALAAGRAAAPSALNGQLTAIRDRVMQALEALPASPLHQAAVPAAEVICEEGAIRDDDGED